MVLGSSHLEEENFENTRIKLKISELYQQINLLVGVNFKSKNDLLKNVLLSLKSRFFLRFGSKALRNCKKLVPTRKPTRMFGVKFGMQGLISVLKSRVFEAPGQKKI
jgi:hypothetical protein